MTALAMDLRELNCGELDLVSGAGGPSARTILIGVGVAVVLGPIGLAAYIASYQANRDD